ncbi:MAG: LAGLIDADG family homing endonuclease [Candidatus Omnitrophota bacterium]
MEQPPLFNWSPELAYAIGLITTDGNLSPDKRHIQFTNTEYELIQLFKDCLQINNKPTITKPSGFGKKYAYRLNFGNVKFYRWLEEIGLKANKTRSLGRLKIADAYFADFLRGHLDGDGSVFTYIDNYRVYKGKRYTNNRLYTVFISASFEHLKWIQDNIKKNISIYGALTSYLRKNAKFPLCKLRFAKKESLKLLPWIYYRPGLPCLSRKRKVAEEFLKNLKSC